MGKRKYAKPEDVKLLKDHITTCKETQDLAYKHGMHCCNLREMLNGKIQMEADLFIQLSHSIWKMVDHVKLR